MTFNTNFNIRRSVQKTWTRHKSTSRTIFRAVFKNVVYSIFSESWSQKKPLRSIFTQKGPARIVASSADKSSDFLTHRSTFRRWNLWKFKSLRQAITRWEKTTAFATDASGCLTRKPKNLSDNWKEKQKCPGTLVVEIPEVNIISLFGKKGLQNRFWIWLISVG